MSLWEKTVALCFTLIGLLYCYYLYETNRPILLEMAQSTAVHNNCTPTCASSISRDVRTSSCQPHRHVVYIKTHKTGSTTLQQVIQMYGYRHHLSFLFNAKSPENGHIRYSFVSNTTQRKFLPPINVARGDYKHYRNYDILAAHMKYNRSVLDWYMKNDSKYISIVREPVAQFESAFDFFKIAQKMAKHDNGARLRRSPIDHWLNNPELYLKDLGGPKSTVWVSLNNGQILDLGLDAKDIQNETEVKRTITKLSKELDLVLITEYFDESLVLLKKLLCWSFEDIVYFSQNQRHRRRRLREPTKQRIRKWNHADVLLYKFFNDTLWRKVAEYGPTFTDDLKMFRKTKEIITQECIGRTEMHLDHKGIVRYRTSHGATQCKLLTDNKELFYEIWKRQSPNFHHVTKNSKSALLQHQLALKRRQMARNRNLQWPARARVRAGYHLPVARKT